MNVAAVPALVAGIVVVFLTGDAWRIFGRGFDTPFWALLTVFLLVSLVVVVNFRAIVPSLRCTALEFEELVQTTPAATLYRRLSELELAPVGTATLPLVARANAVIIYLGIVIANFLVVEFIVSGSLVLVGVIRIDASRTADLMGPGAVAHTLVSLPIDHMVLTRELLTVSLSLGGLALLSFAISIRATGTDFLRKTTSGLRRVLTAYTVYLAAIERQQELTGIPTR